MGVRDDDRVELARTTCVESHDFAAELLRPEAAIYEDARFVSPEGETVAATAGTDALKTKSHTVFPRLFYPQDSIARVSNLSRIFPNEANREKEGTNSM
jgi:hypothetical protein